jgi:hypothetical protein
LKSDSDVMKQGEMGDREFEFTCDKSRWKMEKRKLNAWAINKIY